MKKSVVMILMLCASSVYAQDDKQLLREEADRFFDLEQYNLAISYYRQLITEAGTEPDVVYRVAECYRKSFNYKEAESHYERLQNEPGPGFALAGYYYGLMLKANGKYAESIRSFNDFIYKNQCDDQLFAFVEQAIIDRAGSESALRDANSKSDRYTLAAELFNSTFNDYAPALADSNKLIFTSGRTGSPLTAIDERYGEGFTDNYFFEKRNGSWHDRTRQNIRNLNTKFNDGSGCFNQKGDRYYFTVCGKQGSQCSVVVSDLKSGRWSDARVLNDNVNIEKFETKHPAVSPGGDTLLFVSDRPGGVGGFDIWMSIDAGNDHWGPAMNMGPLINTKMNEVAPAFAAFNHVFFFASDGHQGFGGMDLYMGKTFSDGTESVYNLGYPFNSNRDDCFISFADNRVYISSNREEGFGGFDIYSSKIISPLSFISRLSLRNRSGRHDVALASLWSPGSWMDLMYSRTEDRIEYENLTYERRSIVNKMIVNRNARKENSLADFPGLDEGEYQELLAIAQNQYRKTELQRKYRKTFLTSIRAAGESAITVTGVLVDSLSGKALGSMNIFLMNEQGEVLKVTSSNESGVFRFTNVTGGDDNLYLRFEGQSGNSKPGIADLIVVTDTPDTFTFDNIYFDTDYYDLRPEAKDVLNKLGDFLKMIPDSQVEIFAYADDRGTDSYNFQLTQKRGEAVREYLGSIGVDETSIAIVAKGRQIHADDLNNEEKRQFNRRVEFYINGEKSSALVTADSNK
ncbi:MAG TPA: OmpA family protein [Cyclobacteriaceae bacterium]|nr:OmpA family protein [Cyclobacteriaceae bacterium]